MIIPENIINELINQAQQEAPNETCGYLLGITTPDGDIVTENYWMENIDHSPEHFVRTERPVRRTETCTKQKSEDSRQLAQSSGLALTALTGGPAAG